MAQQFTDRAYESCSVVGTGNVTFLGPKFSYVSVPIGDSICLIEALDANGNPNGQWEVNAGVRAGNTFTRGTVVASSNAGSPVVFSGASSEITLVVSSAFYEAISAAVAQNTADTTANGLAIAQNANDISNNAGNISSNAAAINSNNLAIAQNATDIDGKENGLGIPSAEGQALISTISGIRSWTDLVKAFVDLSDSPGPYLGNAGKLVKVNATADGLVYGDPSGTTVSWGDIQGTLSAQTDLQNELDNKLNVDGTAANSVLLAGQAASYFLNRVNMSGVQSPDTVTFPNVNATDMIDLEHFYSHAWSAGVTDIPTPIVDGGGCTVNIPEMEITFRTGINEHDPLIALIVPAQLGLVVGAGNIGNVYADYNGGAPLYAFRSAGLAKLNLRTEVPLAAVACDGTNTTILSISEYNTDSTALLVRRLTDLGVAHAPGGTVLGDAGTLHFSITAGLFYLGLQPIPNAAIDTSGIDSFTYWYQDGVGGWSSQINQSQISNQLYDDGDGTLATIGNGDYSQSWIYITGSDAGFSVHALYGLDSTNTESQTLAIGPPASIPPALQFLGVLVGRVIVNENNVTTFTTVESAFANEYTPGTATAHNSLPGLQGGDIDDYYHVTAEQIAFFNANPSTDRMRFMGVWADGTYVLNDVVYDLGWLMLANKTTIQRAAPQANGPEFNLYQGADLLDDSVLAKQVITGIQATADNAGYLNGYRVYTYVGAVYSGFIVIDPLGANVIQPVASFKGTSEGWRQFDMPPLIVPAGTTIQVFVTIYFDAPPVTTFNGEWDYVLNTGAPIVPTTGQITHSNANGAPLLVSYTDHNGGDRTAELQTMTIGEEIFGSGRLWVIQSITDNIGYVEFGVSPAVQGTTDGIQTFTFETQTEGLIPYSEDTGYWSTIPDVFNIKGLYGVDTGYQDIVPNDNAYGLDLVVQYATVPTDWDLLSTTNISAAGSSGEYDHSILNNRELPDQHPQAAITGLNTLLNSDQINLNSSVVQSSADTIEAVDVYETILDDDGGEWIDKANVQSWFHDVLNTTDRGSRASFPKTVAVYIELVNQRIKLNDATDATVPPWMDFTSSSGANLGASSDNVVKMLNGKLYYGKAFGLGRIDFIKDSAFIWRSVADIATSGSYQGNIAERNDAKGYDAINPNPIASSGTNDIAVVSAHDGNMNNIVFGALDGGVSRIDEADGDTVTSWTDLGNAAKVCKNIGILNGNEYVIWGASDNDNGYYIQIAPVNQPLVDSRFNNAVTGYFHLSLAINGVWSADTLLVHYNDSQANLTALANNYVGTSKGLIRYYPNHEAYGNSMAALITTLFNSGIMHGDIHGAFLADTAITDLVDTEHVVNGTFDTDTTGWVAGNGAVLSVVTQELKILNSTVAFAFAQVTPKIATTIGKAYTISVDLTLKSTTIGVPSIRVGLGGTNGDYLNITMDAGNISYQGSFVATAVNCFISVLSGSNAIGDFVQVDNISMVEADADRSYNNNGLEVHGTITRTPVASGADLVAYSGWSTINYLEQAYNSRLDFGTGDLYLMGWVKTSGSASEETIFDRRDTTGLGARISLSLIAPSQFLRFRIGATDLITSNIINDGKLHFIVAFRNSGVSYIYIDGVLNTSGANTDDATNVTAVSRVGITWADTAQMQGDMALIRMGGGFPTDEQIKQIYEHEKPLFAENALCTLQGASDNINDIAYSANDNIAAVCSTDYITRFNNLSVVNSGPTIASVVSRGCNGVEMKGT